MYTTNSEPWCKLWTWGDNDVSCRFIDCNQRTIWWGGVGSRGGCVCRGWGEGKYGNLCTFSSLFLWTWNCSKNSLLTKNKWIKEGWMGCKLQGRMWQRGKIWRDSDISSKIKEKNEPSHWKYLPEQSRIRTNMNQHRETSQWNSNISRIKRKIYSLNFSSQRNQTAYKGIKLEWEPIYYQQSLLWEQGFKGEQKVSCMSVCGSV